MQADRYELPDDDANAGSPRSHLSHPEVPDRERTRAVLEIVRNPSDAKLFGAQIVALLGTGLLTVGIGLLAFELAGGDAGGLVGTGQHGWIALVAVWMLLGAETSAVLTPSSRILRRAADDTTGGRCWPHSSRCRTPAS